MISAGTLDIVGLILELAALKSNGVGTGPRLRLVRGRLGAPSFVVALD